MKISMVVRNSKSKDMTGLEKTDLNIYRIYESPNSDRTMCTEEKASLVDIPHPFQMQYRNIY